MLAYIIKSIIYLSIMYLPYMLLLKNESFFRFNRLMLIVIMLLSLVLPLCDFHFLSVANSPTNGIVEIGLPMSIVEGTVAVQHMVKEQTLWEIISGGSWVALLSRIYIIGMTITLLWKLMQMVILQRQIRRGVLWTEAKDGAIIYCHAQDIAPYSWFHQIVISEKDYRNNAEEILRHEMGHILHHHSWDILLLNAVQVLQWANPLVWIMGISLRDVHEYEADDTVLTSGIEARQYQMLLIRKAIGSSSYAFANGFNHSLLSKRITMMLRKRSSPWMRTKGLYIIPVAVIALSAFATPELNNKVDNIVEPERTFVNKVTEKSPNNQTFPKETAPHDTILVEKTGAKKNDIIIMISNGEDITPKLLYFVDGVEHSYATVSKMNVEDIAGVQTVTAEEATKAYGEKGKYGAVHITTKAAESSKDKDILDTAYVLNFYRVSSATFHSVPKDDIQYQFKEEGNGARDMYHAKTAIVAETYPQPGETIDGYVIAYNDALEGATICEVSREGKVLSTTQSDKYGRFVLRINNHKNTLRFSKEGYETVNVDGIARSACYELTHK